MLPGVYLAYKKNGDKYYRSSITYKGKHISLGSYDNKKDASDAYKLASKILTKPDQFKIDAYLDDCVLSLHKWVVLINYRDHNIYFKNPIYLKKNFFLYYLSEDLVLKFDVDDLFYYAHHKILKRGGYLFVSDYGMQINILSRYGIKNFAVPGRDYRFVNSDKTDFRYDNIEVINRFYGVNKIIYKGKTLYEAKILVNGNYIIGRYSDEIQAAIAYNKAAHILQQNGFKKKFPTNYIEDMDDITYASIYNKLRISKKLLKYAEELWSFIYIFN